MSEIVEATYHFLDKLDNSELIKNLTIYKNKLLTNKKILKEISNTKKETDNKTIIAKRKAIFKNNDYQMYMKYYNELSLIVLRINKQYKQFTNTKNSNCY